MRRYLWYAPSWAYGLVVGVLFAVLFGASQFLVGGETVTSLIISVPLAAAIFGTGMALVRRSQRRRLIEEIGELPRGREWEALRAAGRGPVPSDPEVRTTAIRVAEHRGAKARRQRPWALAMFVGWAALAAGYAINGSSDRSAQVYWLAACALFATASGWTLIEPARLRRRIALLSKPGEARR